MAEVCPVCGGAADVVGGRSGGFDMGSGLVGIDVTTSECTNADCGVCWDS